MSFIVIHCYLYDSMPTVCPLYDYRMTLIYCGSMINRDRLTVVDAGISVLSLPVFALCVFAGFELGLVITTMTAIAAAVIGLYNIHKINFPPDPASRDEFFNRG